MSFAIDFIEVANIVEDTLAKLDYTLKSEELPLVVCVADFRNINVDSRLLDQIDQLSNSLITENDTVADLKEMAKYKGGFLTYVIADESLEDLKRKALSNNNNLKYEFFLKIFNLLTAMKVGGGFAKEIKKGSDSVFDQLKKHPLYLMKKEIINKSSNHKVKNILI